MLHQFQRGADFDALAEDYLLLDLGCLTPVQIQRYFGLSPHVLGEADPPVLYEQPVETEHGWRVLRIEDIREEPPPPLEEMRSTIVRILERCLYEAYVAQLHEQAEIDNRWIE